MEKNKQLVPKRRFKEFEGNGEWEKKQFTDIITRISSATSNKSLPRIEYEDIISGRGILNKDIYKKESIKNGIEFENQDILFGKLRPYLKNWLFADFKGVAVGDFWVFRSANSNPKFIYSLIQTERYQKVANLSTGTKMPRSDWKVVSETSFFVPESVGEQKVIGDFIQKIDELIVHQQNKLKKIRLIKESYLSDMFPKEGEKYPKKRFEGFVEAWNRSKLAELASFRRGSFPQPYGKEEWYNGKGSMPFVQVVDVTGQLNLAENTKQRISTLAQPKSIFVGKGTVIVTLQGSLGRVAITQYDSYLDRTLLIFESYKQKIDKYFWAYTIQQKFEIEKEKAPGGTIKTITKKALSTFEISLPSYEEQQKIGRYFNKLDNLIQKEEQKLNKLEQLKQAYLNELFV